MLTFNDLVAVALADRSLQTTPYKGFALEADINLDRVHLIEYPIMSNGMRERKIATHCYYIHNGKIEHYTATHL